MKYINYLVACSLAIIVGIGIGYTWGLNTEAKANYALTTVSKPTNETSKSPPIASESIEAAQKKLPRDKMPDSVKKELAKKLVEFWRSDSGIEASRLEAKIAVRSNFSDFAKEANLTRQQWDKLEALLIEKKSAGRDIYLASQGAEAEIPFQTREALAAQRRSDIDLEIQKLLGDKQTQLKVYEASLNERKIVSDINKMAIFEDEKLTPENIRVLSEKLNSINDLYKIERKGAVDKESLDQRRERYAVFLSEANSILPPAQAAFLKDRITEKLFIDQSKERFSMETKKSLKK